MTLNNYDQSLRFEKVHRDDISDTSLIAFWGSTPHEDSLLYGYYIAVENRFFTFMPDLTAEDVVGNDGYVIHSDGSVHGIGIMLFYYPITILARNGQVSPEVVHFMGLTEFGVHEMQLLLELYLNSMDSVYRSEIGTFFIELYAMRFLDMFSTQVLAEYAYQVRQHFMDVPDIVPQRVHDLTHQIIENAETDFDRIMAIRSYLLQFPYTLTPDVVPRGVCFVDHFLFEGREGYCTYFASAMAVMARIAGVPSRYVEGFVTPHTQYNDGEPVIVTNRMAHAWVEVYLEGFGWLRVEATPAYVYRGAPPPPPSPGVVAPPGGWTGGAYRGPDMDEHMMYMMYRYGGYTSGSGATNIRAGGNIEPWEPRVNLLIAVPIALVVGILLYLLFKYLYVVYIAVKVSRLNANKQVVANFTGILDMVSYYTTPIGKSETPRAYGRHWGKRFAFESDSVFFRDLIALYNKAKYSQHTVSEEERLRMEDAYETMLDVLRQYRIPLVFLYLRYIKRIGVAHITTS